MTTQGVVKRLKSWVPKALVAPPLLVTKIRTAAKRAGSAMTSEPVREYQVLVGELKFHLPPQGDAAVSCVASAPEQCRVYLKLDRITMLTAYYDLRRQVQRLPPE
jgi:hypothetical protein